MNTNKQQIEAYILTDLDRLDPVTVYVTNYKPGSGRIVIECFGSAWASYWGGMSGMTLQEFFISSENDYLLNNLIKNTRQTDFDQINQTANRKGFSICVDSDVDIAMQSDEMAECFGADWMMDLPTCSTVEYEYLGRIVNAIKGAFSDEAVK